MLLFLKEQKNEILLSNKEKLSYGILINTSGAYADKIAHQFDIGKELVILPFRGLYWQLSERSGIKINHLIYPVPDLRYPF